MLLAYSFVLVTLLCPLVSSKKNGTFTALTFNVGGLPALINNNGVKNKTQNSLEIGSRFAKGNYGVINVQEDFNYHAHLYSTDNHTYRTATSGGVPFGSGLNTLSAFPFSNVLREKWKDCDIVEGDCLTPKGYSRVTLALPGNSTLDIYNVHADAGDTRGDSAARRSNFEQVAKAMSSRTGEAAIVMGDTNSRYTREADDIAGSFLQKANLVDSWVQVHRNNSAPLPGTEALICDEPVPLNNSCEVVDKVFYKNGSSLHLFPHQWNYVATDFLDDSNSSLSDHIPIEVSFSYYVIG